MTTAELPAVDEQLANDLSMPAAVDPVRLQSLDIFRGITIAAMLLVNNLGDEEHAYKPLLHSEWHGWTPTDLIFPFFMFIVGVAIPFSMSKRSSDPNFTRRGMLAKIWSRSLALVMLGLLIRAMFGATPPLPEGYTLLSMMRWIVVPFVYISTLALLWPIRSARISNWIPVVVAVIFFTLLIALHFIVRRATDSGLPQSVIGGGMFAPHRYRLPGVLQRIGICYGVAATIALFAGWRTILAASIALLILYSALMFKVPLAGHTTGSLTKDDNLEGRIDERVFDHYTINANGTREYTRKLTYGEYADPEGLLSTIPAAVTPMLGILLGIWLRTDRTNVEKCAAMLAMGVFVAIVGECLDAWLMPINKKIWSPSFVVFTAGLAMLGIGAVFWLVDVMGRRRWALPFAIFGMNSIAAYVGSDVLLRVSQLIKVHGLPLNRFVDERATNGLHSFSAWLQHLSPHFPILDTPANLTMVFAIILIFATLLLLTPLYAAKIYVKV